MEVSDIDLIHNMQKENSKLDQAMERFSIAYIIYAKRFAYFKCQFLQRTVLHWQIISGLHQTN